MQRSAREKNGTVLTRQLQSIGRFASCMLMVAPICLDTSALAQCEVGELHPSDTASAFGSLGVSLDRGALLVGSPATGTLYVFRFDGTSWTEEQKLTASDGAPDDRFGAGASISRDVALVGAWQDDGMGSAYVFRFDGTSWTEEQKLTAPDAEAGDDFGLRVAVRENVALISATEGAIAGTGSAYVFRYDRDAATWSFEQKLVPEDLMPQDGFGWPVVLSPCGTAAVIGASTDDEAGSQSGAAYVYRFDGEQWVMEQKLTASDAEAGDFFGHSAGIDGDVIAIGAFEPSIAGGSVYVFRFDRSTGTWLEETKIAPAELDAGDWFGWNLSLSGDTLAVLSVHDDDAAEDAGAVYVYRDAGEGGLWSPQAKLPVSDPVSGHLFGGGLWLDGDHLAVGAPGDDDAAEDAGSCFVFAGLTGIDYNGNGVADVCEALCPADTNGDGVIDVSDLLIVLSGWGSCS